ncbi:uncharacterized protein [Miscanthus floridulus]|uniref:uncharacterized protein n=1 Tax=Miscanthus floridulus TaxID=154761 RepID=UPI003459B01F
MDQWAEEDEEEEEEEAAAAKQRKNLIFSATELIDTYHLENMANRKEYRQAKESGYDWVIRTLGHSTECYNMFRMERAVFDSLHNLLVQSYGLRSTRRMSLVESLAMFLWMLVGDIIRPLDPEFMTPHPRVRNPMFAPFFDNCIGAIDGTHIEVVVPMTELITHMNRKSKTSQNVLAICDFDLRFTFIVTGWSGSVHDMRVFKAALDKFGSLFPHPPQGKFYVVDSGFSNQPGYLAPYKGTKYHLQEYNQGPPTRVSRLEP